MTPYWVKFNGRSSACVEASDETEAKKLGAELGGKDVVSVTILPYPADPRLNKYERPLENGRKVVCPAFCYTPEQCKGRTSCPKSYACSE